MRKIVFILAVIAAFAFELPAGKGYCTFISSTGACFNQEVAGTGRCAQHMLSGYPPSTPQPCLCSAEIVTADAPRTCMRPCKSGCNYCPQHCIAPPLADTTHQ